LSPNKQGNQYIPVGLGALQLGYIEISELIPLVCLAGTSIPNEVMRNVRIAV